MIVFSVCCGIVVACLTGVFVGAGSIVIPNIYDNGVERVYNNSDFDAFAVCSQWPFPCGEQDSMIIDGWLNDNPALVINIGHYQQKYDFDTTTSNSNNNKYTLKVMITNTNQKWDGDEWDHAQIMQYFSTYFNQNIVYTYGQQVEILLLNLNEDITMLVVGKDNVKKYTQPLADMTRHIASNQELVERVHNFVEN